MDCLLIDGKIDLLIMHIDSLSFFTNTSPIQHYILTQINPPPIQSTIAKRYARKERSNIHQVKTQYLGARTVSTAYCPAPLPHNTAVVLAVSKFRGS